MRSAKALAQYSEWPRLDHVVARFEVRLGHVSRVRRGQDSREYNSAIHSTDATTNRHDSNIHRRKRYERIYERRDTRDERGKRKDERARERDAHSSKHRQIHVQRGPQTETENKSKEARTQGDDRHNTDRERNACT